MQWGDLTFTNTPIGNFQGNKKGLLTQILDTIDE